MAVQGVGKRYAEAIFDLATTPESREYWLSTLRTLADAVQDDETRAFFNNPAVSAQAKGNALSSVMPGGINDEARNLARMLIQRRRFDLIPSILEALEELALRSRGIAIADVTTAVPLTEQQQSEVRAQLSRIVGSEVEIRARVDLSIVGGIVARIGDQLIDGSVRTQLRELRATLGRR
jgi:F-type H+-transporting ATPase subunit delta